MVASVLAGAPALFGQGTFQNLDFEAAQLILVDPVIGYYDFAAALPGWSGYIGGVLQTKFIPSMPLDPRFAYITILAPPIIAPQGRYAVSFKDGKDQLTGATIPVTLSQTGLVPAGTKSLEFIAAGDGTAVSLGGHELTKVELGPDRWGADISAYAGQTLELQFSVYAPFLDDIRFSSSAIPEPSVFALAGMGLAAVVVARLRRRRCGPCR